MKGWVYIITNKAMPNLLKVGFSTKDPELRAQELHTTGVPYRFVVEYDVLVNEPRDIEQAAHNLLKNYHANKEWFNCSIDIAIQAIRKAATGKNLLENRRHCSSASQNKNLNYTPTISRHHNSNTHSERASKNLNYTPTISGYHNSNTRYNDFFVTGTSGQVRDVDLLMEILNSNESMATIKLADFALGLVKTRDGMQQIKFYLFNGSTIQRNYSALFFKRIGEKNILIQALNEGKIDKVQALSK
jgi:hypothetical protein